MKLKYAAAPAAGMRRLVQHGLVAVILGCMLLAVSGCGLDPGTARKTEGPNVKTLPETQKKSVPPKEESKPEAEKQYAYTFPLTGTGSDKQVKDRPIMAMVENSPAARPQTGLDQADIVYEILAEGEITRFAAVYQSESPKTIGPVRSIRPYYVQVGEGHNALVVHAGWSQAAINMINKQKVNHFDQVYGDHKYYWRDDSRKPPHNLYTSIERIRQGAKDKGYSAQWNGPVFQFASKDAAPQAQQKAVQLKINYIRGYYVSYQYDAAASTYKRFMEGQAHLDKESGKQLTAANILVYESKHRILDNEGRRAVDVYGPGKGYLVTKGAVQEITWERKQGIILPFINGKEVPLSPGKTWIQIVPEGSEITFE